MTATIVGMVKAKRGYTRDFTPKIRTPESRRRITIDWIPPTLFDRIERAAKAQGMSLRAFALQALKERITEAPKEPA